MPDDAEQHGRDLYTRAVALEFGAIGAFVPRAAPVVTTVTMKQCRLALLAAGILPQVTAAISSMPMAAQISWEFSQTVLKTDPLVQQLAVAFGLNLDTLFAAAAAL